MNIISCNRPPKSTAMPQSYQPVLCCCDQALLDCRTVPAAPGVRPLQKIQHTALAAAYAAAAVHCATVHRALLALDRSSCSINTSDVFHHRCGSDGVLRWQAMQCPSIGGSVLGSTTATACPASSCCSGRRCWFGCKTASQLLEMLGCLCCQCISEQVANQGMQANGLHVLINDIQQQHQQQQSSATAAAAAAHDMLLGSSSLQVQAAEHLGLNI